MKRPRRPKVLWFNAINGYGLRYDKPIKLTYNGDWYESSNRYDESFDFDLAGLDGERSFKKLGTNVDDGYQNFTSAKKKDVELWTVGAKAIIRQLKYFTE